MNNEYDFRKSKKETNMKEQTSIRKSVKHWKEMILWVTEQDPMNKVDRNIMKGQIGFTWFDEDCDLCSEFGDVKCLDCPLQKAFGKCGKDGVDNAWDKVYSAKIWEVWLIEGRKLLVQLESLIQPTKAEALRAIYDEAGVAFDALYHLRQDLLNQFNQAEEEEEINKKDE